MCMEMINFLFHYKCRESLVIMICDIKGKNLCGILEHCEI